MKARNREEGLATRDFTKVSSSKVSILQFATYQTGLKAMNQQEAPTHATTVALNTKSLASSVLIPSTFKGTTNDNPELDQEEDEQSQQEQDSHCVGYIGSSSDACMSMVHYDGFDSFVGFPLTDDGDDDEVNVRSPIVCKSARFSASSSPTCVSTLGRDEPSWTLQEFQEYLVMLEMLEDVCSTSEGEGMCLSADSLSQMERLLTSLLPQGV